MLGNLSFRVAVAVMVVAVALSAASSSFFYQRIQTHEIAAAKKKLWQLGKTVQRTASIAAYLDNEEIAMDAVLGLAGNDMVGFIILSSLTGLKVEHGQDKKGTSYERCEGQFMVSLDLMAPFSENEQIGTLQIFPKHGMIEANARKEALERSSLLFSYTFIVALIVLLCMQLLFVRALKKIAQQLALIEPGSTHCLQTPIGHRKDEIGGLVSNINNLLKLVKAKLDSERSLRQEVESLERQFRMIFERASVGIFLVNEKCSLIMANEAFWNLVDCQETAADHDGCGTLEDIFVDHGEVSDIINTTLHRQVTTGLELELKTERDENRRWAHCLFNLVKRDESGQTFIQGILTDITELKIKEEQLRYQAGHDPLTGLMNRRASDQAINDMLEWAEEVQQRVALFLIDLDDFKPVNDTYGHAVGDLVLVEIAQRMQTFKRQDNIAARLGGDEFLFAIAGDISRENLHHIAQRLIDLLTSPIDLKETKISIGVSIGIAITALPGQSRKQLLGQADQALYQVKSQGKNRFLIQPDPETV